MRYRLKQKYHGSRFEVDLWATDDRVDNVLSLEWIGFYTQEPGISTHLRKPFPDLTTFDIDERDCIFPTALYSSEDGESLSIDGESLYFRAPGTYVHRYNINNVEWTKERTFIIGAPKAAFEVIT